MKQKCSKKTVINFVIGIFVVFFGLFANVFAQYYYFSSGWNTYQQWCSEVLEVRVNSEWKNVRAGRFHLVLDPLTTTYPQTSDVNELRSFFNASNETFINWTSEWSPSWKWDSNYTILQVDRNNWANDYNWTNKLYANVNFVPVFSGGMYDIVFGMEYLSGDVTTETTLSMAWWAELIDSEQQNLYRTWTFAVLQEPCVADTNKPTITNVSIANNSTKISYLSGLTFSLKDEWWVNWEKNVPYIKTDWSPWTWNVWWTISNQYWIDPGSFQLILSGNGQTKSITNTTPWVSISWNWKTWQNNWLNANVTIESDALFNFGIEKKITATFKFWDRAGNTWEYTINFNVPKWPELVSKSASPANGDVYVNLSAPIKLWIKDDRAGVDSGTIKITVGGINWTTYWPYIFSWSDLNLSWVQWNANTPDYYISILNHKDFPTSGTIEVKVYAEDMVWNVDKIDDYSFSTRPNCTEFQCCEPVLLNLWDTGATYYSNTWLVISGWNNPTFSVDGENNTWTIDCNAEDNWLSVYNWEDNFVFFTDEPTLTILGTWIKWVLSWDVLILSYMVNSSEIIIDKPMNSGSLFTWDIEVQWHLTWVENEEDWLSWYVVQIDWYNFDTWLFIDGTWIIESLPDWEYTISIYPVDLWWHTGNKTELTVLVDTTWPDFEFANGSGYECETWYLEIVWDFDDLSDIHLLPYSFDKINWTWNNRVIIDSQNSTWSVSITWYVRDSLENISENLAVYEFVDTWIFIDFDNVDLSLLTWEYTTWIVNLLESFWANEWNCGITNLWFSVLSCENAIMNERDYVIWK